MILTYILSGSFYSDEEMKLKGANEEKRELCVFVCVGGGERGFRFKDIIGPGLVSDGS